MATRDEVAKALHDVDCGCGDFRPDEDAYYDKIADHVIKKLDKQAAAFSTKPL